MHVLIGAGVVKIAAPVVAHHGELAVGGGIEFYSEEMRFPRVTTGTEQFAEHVGAVLVGTVSGEFPAKFARCIFSRKEWRSEWRVRTDRGVEMPMFHTVLRK